jgi:hypothetical protein
MKSEIDVELMLNNLKASEKKVQNTIINALLEAFNEILDYDGKRSILSYAQLEHWMNGKLPPSETSSLKDFEKLIKAMRTLLQYSQDILFEIGRKFSIYLDPFGTSFKDFIEMINRYISDLEISFKEVSPNVFDVILRWKGENADLMHDPWLLYFYEGALTEGMRKTIGGKVHMKVISNTKLTCEFRITGEKAK